MSLNKTLDRLFDEIRREAKRNPDFADRLDAVLRVHVSRRDVDDEAISEVEAAGATAELIESDGDKASLPSPTPTPSFSPVGLYQREGEEGLVAALAPLDAAMLTSLVAEHNLDPVGAAEGLEGEALAAFVVAQVKKRVERDQKLFDY
jgi:LPS sulfotransferase NodH